MLRVKGTTISLTRGDSLRVKINIFNSQGEQYIPVEGDTITFALKKDYTDQIPLITKDIPIDTMELHLTPNDTKQLEQPAEYVYDISLTYGDTGDIDTFIDKAKFRITEEVG